MDMKKATIFITALIIVIGSINVAFAADSLNYESEFKVWNVDEETYKLIYGGSGTVKIKVLDKDNHILYNGTVKSKDGFMKPFDLSQLPFGTYKFRLEVGGAIMEEVITIKSPKEKYSHLIDIQESVYRGMFELYVKEAGTNFDLYILDDKGEVVFQDETGAGSKAYDLSKLSMEQIKVLIYSDQEIVKEAILKI